MGAKEAPRLLGVKHMDRVLVGHDDLLGMPYRDCLATTNGSKNWAPAHRGGDESPVTRAVRLTVPMDFYSSCAQGFARVAACTLPIVAVDPAAQRRRGHRPGARPATTRAWRVAIFPELCLSGYAIDDLFLQDPLLDAVDDAARPDRRGHRRPASRGRRGRAAARRATGVYNCARRHPRRPRSSASRRSPTCPTTASSTSGATSRPATTSAARPSTSPGDRGPVRPRPALPGRPTCPASCSTSRSARTCGCPSRRATRPRSPARRSCSNLSGVADHRRARRGPPPARPQRARRAASPPTSMPRPASGRARPTCRGTA